VVSATLSEGFSSIRNFFSMERIKLCFAVEIHRKQKKQSIFNEYT